LAEPEQVLLVQTVLPDQWVALRILVALLGVVHSVLLLLVAVVAVVLAQSLNSLAAVAEECLVPLTMDLHSTAVLVVVELLVLLLL
jgi:hypothetical protein